MGDHFEQEKKYPPGPVISRSKLFRDTGPGNLGS